MGVNLSTAHHKFSEGIREVEVRSSQVAFLNKISSFITSRFQLHTLWSEAEKFDLWHIG